MLRTLTNVDQDAALEFDICIVGAGAAGITMAHRLRSSGLNVVLLEAGGFVQPEIGPAHPYQGQNVGRPYSLTVSRLRYFGGTTNHWGGWCRPLDALDFEPRQHVPLSGWPFGLGELVPYYKEASRYCQIDPPGFELDSLPGAGRPREIFFSHHDRDFVEKQFRFSPPTRFGEVYRPAIRDSERIHCFVHSTATELEVERGRVERLEVRGLDDKRFYVRAGAFVLAMGAIENARLLLHSDRTVPGGVGNDSDWVGRCFSDHPGKTIGRLQSRRPLPYVQYERDGIRLLPHLSLSDDVLLEQRMVNFGIMCLANHRAAPLFEGPWDLEATTQAGQEPEAEPADGRRAGGGQLGGQPGGRGRAPFYNVLVRLEAVPNPASRVTLLPRRDAFGMRRVRLDWRLDGIEFETLDQLADLLGRKVGEHKLARFQRTFWDSPEERQLEMLNQSHHMGTTRMSLRPADGVVDPDGRAHRIQNLYLTGGSVFPTFGFTNPTLTVVALAVRLADHLTATVRGG